METVTITLEEYKFLILENQSLRNENIFLKDRIDRGIAEIRFEIAEIRENMK